MDLSAFTAPIVETWRSAHADGRVTIRELIWLVWVVIREASTALVNAALSGPAKRALVAAEVSRVIELIWPQVAATSLLIRLAAWIPWVNVKAIVIVAADSLIDLIYKEVVKPAADDTQIVPENSQ